MNHTVNSKVSSTIRISLALALATAFVACEDIPPPAPQTRPPVAAAPPPPETTPTPLPVTPRPAPVVTPEVPKTEPVVEIDKDPFVAARQMLEAGGVDKALELARQATLRTPKRSAAWNTLGRAQLRAGKRK